MKKHSAQFVFREYGGWSSSIYTDNELIEGGAHLFRGYYMAASGMISQQRRQEMITNNVANANTPGYKADQASLRSFPELLIQQMNTHRLPVQESINKRTKQPIGTLNTGVYVQELTPNFSQGPIRETEMVTDMAIVDGDYPDEAGAVFFKVQNNAGDIRYTRNGNFQVDGAGYLTTNDGHYVLDRADNPIFTDGLDFTVGADGSIQLGNDLTPLGLAYIANTNDLTKEGMDLFNPDPGNAEVLDPAVAGATYTIQQGFLEGSTVDPAQSMVEMIQAYRNFELNQRVLKEFDSTMEKTVNVVGRLR